MLASGKGALCKDEEGGVTCALVLSCSCLLPLLVQQKLSHSSIFDEFVFLERLAVGHCAIFGVIGLVREALAREQMGTWAES